LVLRWLDCLIVILLLRNTRHKFIELIFNYISLRLTLVLRVLIVVALVILLVIIWSLFIRLLVLLLVSILWTGGELILLEVWLEYK